MSSYASFRDPGGFVFLHKDKYYRQINRSEKDNYDQLLTSGLYQKLVSQELILPHTEVRGASIPRTREAYKIIQPQAVPFVSYPYEWCFSQLKTAALTTLLLQKLSLDYRMSLKDASAYNIQFVEGKAKLIDTLSFEKYTPGKPWIAYRQFCQFFLSPLALMSYKDVRLSKLLTSFIDGLPLDITSRLLPLGAYLSPSLWLHIFAHARTQQKSASNIDISHKNFSLQAQRGLVDSLEGTIHQLAYKKHPSAWVQYYEKNSYSDTDFYLKSNIVASFIDKVKPSRVYDLGANTGYFSQLCAQNNIFTLAFDSDHDCIENLYRKTVSSRISSLLPLWVDLTNPSPGIGWNNQERSTLFERGKADLVLFLALIHHLAINNNLPLNYIADFLSRLGQFLIIEFVPKTDIQVQKLLSVRKDIFIFYNMRHFETIFRKYFQIIAKRSLPESKRILYLMRKTRPL